MADLTNYKIFKNENFEILTDTGFQDFEGIIVGENPNKIKLEFSNGMRLVCTPKHKLILKDGSWKYAKDISDDILYNNLTIISKDEYENDEKVYEILHVHNGHKYLINKMILQHQCLIIDECAFIQPHIMDEFWNSVIPIISSSSQTKIFLISTPNGTANKFYEIYSAAERGEAKGWHHEKMEWHELPSRGKKWKEDMIESLGSQEAFDQEFGCVGKDTKITLRKIGESKPLVERISDFFKRIP